MTFQELPWLIFSLFLRGGFDFHHDPDKTPAGGFNIVSMFLLAWLILAVVLTAQVILRDVTGQRWALQRQALGFAARNCRFTLSGGQGAAVLLTAVFTGLPPITPASPICFYGLRKVWRQLRREGIAVARCTRLPPAHDVMPC